MENTHTRISWRVVAPVSPPDPQTLSHRGRNTKSNCPHNVRSESTLRTEIFRWRKQKATYSDSSRSSAGSWTRGPLPTRGLYPGSNSRGSGGSNPCSKTGSDFESAQPRPRSRTSWKRYPPNVNASFFWEQSVCYVTSPRYSVISVKRKWHDTGKVCVWSKSLVLPWHGSVSRQNAI